MKELNSLIEAMEGSIELTRHNQLATHNLFDLTCKAIHLNMLLADYLSIVTHFGVSEQAKEFNKTLDDVIEIIKAMSEEKRYEKRKEGNDFGNEFGAGPSPSSN